MHAQDDEGQILGVDFGLKRIGLSTCDSARKVAVGAGALSGLSGRTLARSIRSAALERGINLIVIGKPPEGFRDSEKVINGAEALANRLRKDGFQVEWIDESFTTSAVLSDRRRIGGKSSKQKYWIDESAAILILQNYINMLNSEK